MSTPLVSSVAGIPVLRVVHIYFALEVRRHVGLKRIYDGFGLFDFDSRV